MTDTRKLSFTLPNGATFMAEGSDDLIEKALHEFKAFMADPASAAKPAGKNGTRSTANVVPDSDIPAPTIRVRASVWLPRVCFRVAAM